MEEDAGSLEAMLQKALAEAKAAKTVAHEGTPPPMPEPTIFGLTFGGMIAGLVISTIGVGFIIYAKHESHLLFAIFGLALCVIPFFVTATLWLSVAGAVLVIVPLLLKRFLYW